MPSRPPHSTRPLPVIGGTVRCSVEGLVATNRAWANVVHCRFSGGASYPSAADITALHGVLGRLWTGTAYASGTAWLTKCMNNVVTQQIRYYVLNGTATPQLIALVGAGSSSTGTSSPSEVAACLTIRTAKRGRRYRGRIYLPAPHSSQINTNGNFNQIMVDGILAQYDGMIGAMSGISWEFGVATYGHSWTWNDVTQAWQENTWTPDFTPSGSGSLFRSMDLRPDVQRRRK